MNTKQFTSFLMCLMVMAMVHSLSFAGSALDPIRFSIGTTATQVSLNEEFEIKISAKYLNIPSSVAFVFEGSNSFRLKLVVPEGFVQTGGDFRDFTGTELSKSKPTATYTVRGKFVSSSDNGTFQLLRSHKNSDNQSTFIEVGRLSFSLKEGGEVAANDPAARIMLSPAPAYVPFMTMGQLRAGLADTATVIYVIEAKRSGIFILDFTDTITPDDSVLTVASGTRRYKRKHDNVFYPEWWGAIGNGIDDDRFALQMASNAAFTWKAELRLHGEYVISSNLSLKSNVSGFGVIKTKNLASVNIDVNGVTVKDITINGQFLGIPSGKGLYSWGSKNITVQNVKVFSVLSPGFWFRNTDYIKIISCTTKDTKGDSGDGIYVKESISPQIVNNHCSDFSRIGITCEGSVDKFTSDAIIIGNTCFDALESLNPTGYPNAGIWAENIAGIIIEGNTVNNLFARGIVVTPSIDDQSQYQYIISNNKVFDVKSSGNHVGVGIALSYAHNQVATISSNIITDCKKGIDVGWAQLVNIAGNTFNKKNQQADWFVSNINLVPSIQEWKSNYVISNCINNINSTTNTPVTVANVSGQKANITITDCIGNFAFLHQERTIEGNISVSNTVMDWSSVVATGTNRIFNISGRALYDNCDLVLPKNVDLTASATEFSILNSRVRADSATRIQIYQWGAKIIRISNSSLRNVRFYNLRRTSDDHEIYLSGSTFDGYHQTEGLFEASIKPIARLEVIGCTFSSSIGATPIQFPGGVLHSAIGHNTYYTNALTSGFMPSRQSISLTRGTSAQRPIITQIGYLYFDTDISREIYWNGNEWIVLTNPPSAILNTSVSAPSKTLLNSLYGTLRAGSIVTYQSISGGAREYRKLNDAGTSDWVQTIWSTGVKSLTL